VHPDLFGTRSATEQVLSASASASINIGYNLLRNPVSRAQYLLQLHGVDAIGEAAQTAVPPALLMEVMEGREALEDTSAANAPQVRELLAIAQARVRALQEEFSQHYSSLQLPAAAEAVAALQYMTKLVAEANEWVELREAEAADRQRAEERAALLR